MIKPGKFDRKLREMADEDPRVRRKAARKLSEYADPQTVDPLLQAMQDTDVFVRKHAIVGLGNLANRDAIGPLLESSRDKRGGVRRESARALAQICRAHPDLIPTALPAILAAARRDNAHQRVQYSLALCAIGTRAIPFLCLEYNSFRNTVYRECIEMALVLMEQREQLDVVRCLLSDSTLTAPQQWTILELLTRRRPRILFTPRRRHDPRLYCETIASDPREQEETRRGAKGILDYLSLGRASQRDDTDLKERTELLRMTTAPTTNPEDGQHLLRASVETDSTQHSTERSPEPSTGTKRRPQSSLARLITRLRHLFD